MAAVDEIVACELEEVPRPEIVKSVPGVCEGRSGTLVSPYSGKEVSRVDDYFIELIHETGHLFGFADRYQGTEGKAQEGFENNAMAATGAARDRSLHATQIEDAALFALAFAGPGGKVEGKELRQISLDPGHRSAARRCYLWFFQSLQPTHSAIHRTGAV